jgi:signal transduction histidine kinase/CheY-like chemotaxis protein
MGEHRSADSHESPHLPRGADEAAPAADREAPRDVAREEGRDAAGPLRAALARSEAERRELEEQLRQAQKMEAIGRLTGGIAHDFNNLLTIIRGGAELLLAGLAPDDSRREDALEVLRAADRASSLTRQLLAFSRRQRPEPRPVELNEVVAALEPMLTRLLGADIAVATRLAPDAGAVLADPGQLEQVIMNLAVNARDAMPDGGALVLETAAVPPPPADGDPMAPGAIELRVTDSGHGMDERTRSRIFEPFFTTKPHGTGLGLSIVRGIVAQAGGEISVRSAPHRGTTFRIRLPRQVDAPPSREAPASPDQGAHPGASILIVDDEAVLRGMVARMLRRHGYTVIEAASPAQAVSALREPATPVDLVLTDLVMPGMSGRDLGAHVGALRPGVPIVFMSGWLDDLPPPAAAPPALARARFLAKPFTNDELLRTVRASLEGG